MLRQFTLSQAEKLTPLDLGPSVKSIAGRWWPDSEPAISAQLQRLAQADGGRHWRHTLTVVAVVNVLIAGPRHPDWPQTVRALAGSPRLTDWLARTRPQLAPDLLRLIALLHDLGKYISPSGHPEISFRLFGQAVGGNLPPGSPEALAALVIRHHADLGSLQAGEVSPVALLGLLDGLRCGRAEPAQFLTTLLWLTLADWIAYDMLTAPVMAGLLADADFLRRELPQIRANPGAAGLPEIKQHLWQQAVQQTSTRLSRLTPYAFATPPPPEVRPLPAPVEMAAQMAGLDWPEFQAKFALLRLEGAYAVFGGFLEVAPDFESRVLLAVQQLSRWLPSKSQVQAFEAGPGLGYVVNFRPITAAPGQKSPQALQEALAGVAPIAFNPAGDRLRPPVVAQPVNIPLPLWGNS